MRDRQSAGTLAAPSHWPLVVMPAGLALVILALTACTPEPPGPVDDEAPVDGACPLPFGKLRDPATLPACCPQYGGAHCLPADALPDGYDSQVDECEGGGYCLPDIFISTGGAFTPKACTSLNGAPGACLSGCLPDVGAYYNVLPQDVCGDQERCAPCINPIDGQPSGACELGAPTCDAADAGPSAPPADGSAGLCKDHVGPPVLDPATLEPCAAGAHCLDRGLIADEDEPDLNACDGTTLCVPDELIASGGNYTPKRCASIAGREGRCLSLAIPKIGTQQDLLPVDTCAPATHRCAPCYDPFTGADTGACRVGCGPGPKEPANAFAACCEDRGRCAPASVAGERAGDLGKDTCTTAGDVCIPLEYAGGSYTPASCNTGLISLIYGADYKPGVCLPRCVPKVGSAPFLGQDDCAMPGQLCVPCLDPTTKQPSGACAP